MKKIVIVGGGTAGLITAGLMNSYWGDDAQIRIIHDSNIKTIGVGESTTPIFMNVLRILNIELEELISEIDTTLKLGISFKDWIPGKEYFHGFSEIEESDEGFFRRTHDDSSAYYSILNGSFNGGENFSNPGTELPSDNFESISAYAIHIDTQRFTELLTKKLKERGVEFVDDFVERVRVNSECTEISHIECRDSGIINADFFVDASGFSTILFKHLNPSWIDTSNSLPIDRAIPQQVPNISGEIPAYTLAEATDNGWIWQLPIGDRYGTGYLYSSKFTSDEEAKLKYNRWLLENHNVELTTDRVIKYRPGYYENYWIGNCMAVGLSSGFIEPLESTSMQLLSAQVYDFLVFNSTLNNLSFNQSHVNHSNRVKYEVIFNFICLHYCTNRTDSKFWEYMTNNKIRWVKEFEDKCNNEFIESSVFGGTKYAVFSYDSFVQIADGLNLFNKDSLREWLIVKPNAQQILDVSEQIYESQQQYRTRNRWMSHKEVLEVNKY